MIRKNKLIASIALIIILLFIYQYYTPYKIEYFGNYHKIWAHRVNSVQKLKSAINYFDGIELDLYYDDKKNILEVNHPPTKSINLSFKEYLKSLPKNQKPKLWLDCKNLTTKNSAIYLSEIKEALYSKKYSNFDVLIESSDPESLTFFKKNNFKTSYYLPSNLNEKKLNRVNTIIKKYPFLGISTTINQYKIIKEYFPKQKKYIWSINRVFSPNPLLVRSMLKDTTVKVILTKYVHQKGDR